MWKTAAAVLVALLIGLAAGYQLGHVKVSTETAATQPAAVAKPIARASTTVGMPTANRETADVEKESPTVRRERMSKLLTILELSKTGQGSMNVPVFDQDRHLTKAVRTLLEIDDAQAAALNSVLESAYQQAGEISVQLATVRPDPEHGGLVITVPPFPEAGGKIYDQTMAQFQATLDSDRTEILMGLLSNQYGDNNPANLGLEARTIAVWRKQGDDGNGKSRNFIVFKEERTLTNQIVNGQPAAGSASTSQGQLLDRSQLVQHLGALGSKLIPPDF